MVTPETRNIEQVRAHATLLTRVCDMAESNLWRVSLSELAAGYFKARQSMDDRNEKDRALVKLLHENLRNGLDHKPFLSLDEMAEQDLVTVQQLAWLRNWLDD